MELMIIVSDKTELVKSYIEAHWKVGDLYNKCLFQF